MQDSVFIFIKVLSLSQDSDNIFDNVLIDKLNSQGVVFCVNSELRTELVIHIVNSFFFKFIPMVL